MRTELPWLRNHIERQLPEQLTEPNQLERWQLSANTLLRDGLFLPRELS